MHKKLSIVIPIWIKDAEILDLTRKCVSSLHEFSSDYELIIIDNNSFWPLTDLALGADIYVRNKENTGNGTAWNQGAHLASGEYILFADNDVEFSKDWQEPMINCLSSDPETGVVFPYTLNYRDEDEFNAKLSGFFWMTRKSTFSEIGDISSIYGIANFEDSDWFRRAQLKNYKLTCVSQVKIKHFSRASCDKNAEVQQIYKRNEEYYFNTYGVLPFLDKEI